MWNVTGILKERMADLKGQFEYFRQKILILKEEVAGIHHNFCTIT